jgi:hypothetical protein
MRSLTFAKYRRRQSNLSIVISMPEDKRFDRSLSDSTTTQPFEGPQLVSAATSATPPSAATAAPTTPATAASCRMTARALVASTAGPVLALQTI